jgi:predicted Zn-dependent protease
MHQPRTPRLLVLSLLLGLMAGAAPAQLPSLGGDEDLPVQMERKIGDRIAKEIYRDPDYLDDPLLLEYVLSIWQPLLAAARQRGDLPADLDERFAWIVFLDRDPTVNAFALPGGYLGIHTGLIALSNNRAEVAAVMAHELSHVTQRHISRSFGQQTKQQPLLIAAMLLGAAAVTKSPDLANALLMGGQAAAIQGQLNFSRDMEREADRVGFGVLTQAGFDGAGMVQMFELLDKANRLNDFGNYPYLRSHPLTGERIADAQSRVHNLNAASGSRLNDDPLAMMMASRARILSAPGVDSLRALAAQALSLDFEQAPWPEKMARLYSASLAEYQLRDRAQAQKHQAQLQSLARTLPGLDEAAQHAVDLLGIEVRLSPEAKSSMPLKALVDRILAPELAQGLSKTRRSSLMLWAQAQAQLGAWASVTETLPTWLSDHPNDAFAWRLLAQAHEAQGQTLRSVRALAEAQTAELDYTGALERLRAAQKIAQKQGDDHVEQSILYSRMRTISEKQRNQLDDEKSIK